MVLKLTGVIDWSWVYVTLPFWAGFAIVGIVLIFVLVLKAVLSMRSNVLYRK